MPGPPVTLAAFLAVAALLLAVVHALRALGWVRAAAEILALALFLFLGGARSATALLLALAVALAAMSMAAWLWWLSPWGRSLSAALLAASAALGMAPTAVLAGVLPVTAPGAFLGAPVAGSAIALVLVFAWTLAAELAERTEARGARALGLRASVALGGLAFAEALRWTWTRFSVEAALPPPAAWVAWGLLWSIPALVALTGRAAVLPESLVGLLGSAGRRLPAAALLLLLGATVAVATRAGEPRLAAAAAGPLLPPLALLSAGPPLERWRGRAFARLGGVQDFVAVLMKPRNGVPWTPEDRAFLRAGVRTLARWAPGFLLFLLPGGLGLLGIYAWLLDRRRGRAGAAAAAAGRRADDVAA